MCSLGSVGESSDLAARVEAAGGYQRDWGPAMLDGWAVRTADAALVEAEDRVVDVGCGTGVVARECARRVGAAGSVTGIDPNEAMLTIANRTGGEIVWLEGRAEDLPLPDRSCDKVVSQFAMMFFGDRITAASEMWRVLAPGGRMAVVVSGPIEATPQYEALVDLARLHMGEDVADDMGGPFALGDLEAVASIFDRAGIAGFEIETVWGWERFRSASGFAEAEVRSSAALADLLDELAFEAMLTDADELMQEMLDSEGRLVFKSPAHVVTAVKP